MTNTHINVGGHKITVNKRDKLWENPSPNSAFAEQDITIPNDTDYDELWWCFKGYSNYTNVVSFVTITQPRFQQSSVTWTGYSSNKWYIWSRQLTGNSVNNTYTIRAGSQVDNGAGAGGGEHNNRLIPLYVLGVKY